MKLKKIIFSPAATILAFVLAVALLLYSTVGGARAALTYISDNYVSQIQLFDIGVTLVENGEPVAWRNYNSRTADGTWSTQDPDPGYLLGNLLPKPTDGHTPQIVLDHPYKEEISVRNSGNIDQYVRVTLYRYWVNKDQDGVPLSDRLSDKRMDLDPGFIDLELANVADGGPWLLDEKASTKERTVLYYNTVLPGTGTVEGGGATVPLSATLTIHSAYTDEGGTVHSIKANPHQETLADGTVLYTYDYDDVTFVLEARVDAIQKNNAADAAHSAWGRQVQIDGTTLTLVN